MIIKENKSLNFSKKPRTYSKIRFIIIHYTGMQSERVSITKLKNPKSKVSCHYFIGRQGNVLRMVDDSRVAWHAGESRWKNTKNLNEFSIGIEIQNKGHFINYQNFSKKQIRSLIKLVKILMKKYKIKAKDVLGHSDIAPLRKQDPGEKFPWNILSNNGAAIWYPKHKMSKFDIDSKNKRKIFFKNIYQIGYRFFNLKKKSNKDRIIIKAFQRRFLPKEVNGKITLKTLKISSLLAKNA